MHEFEFEIRISDRIQTVKMPALGGAGAHQKSCVLAVFGDCVSYVSDDDAG
jgi:hypothetical protein